MTATQTKPIDVYFWPTPNGKKITMALEELGVPYKIHPVHIGKDEQFKPEFLAVAPNNKIPAIVDPEGPGGEPLSLFESGAILQYLGRKFGKIYPDDERGRARVDEWLHWQIAGFGPMLGQANHFMNVAPEKLPYAINRFQEETRRLYGVLDKRLAARAFIADTFSIADIACYGWAKSHARHGVDLADFPNVAAWVARMDERPGVARGFAVTP